MPSYLTKLEQEVQELREVNEWLRDTIGKRDDRIRHLIKLGLETSEYGLQTHREMWEREEEL
jgi:hypothetical protein